jgi:hypothetical protein
MALAGVVGVLAWLSSQKLQSGLVNVSTTQEIFTTNQKDGTENVSTQLNVSACQKAEGKNVFLVCGFMQKQISRGVHTTFLNMEL